MVVAFKSGNRHAYALIYREYRPVAEAICQRILGNHDDAAEAAQETMLKVFQGLPRFNGRYLVRAWVARIATNVCLDILRKRGRRLEEVDTPEADELEKADALAVRALLEDPGSLIERRDEQRRVRELLFDLPAHHRDALIMREFDGLSHEDIAAKLNMTAPQVKALLHRAKKGFKKAWDVETGRASAFVWPSLLVPVRWVKRLVAPARDVVHEASTPVISLTSQPAVIHATGIVSERVAAGAGALLVAGTIGFGAAVLPNSAVPSNPPALKAPAAVGADQPLAVPRAGTPSATAPLVVVEEPTGLPVVEEPETLEPAPEQTPLEPTPSGQPQPEPQPTEQPPPPDWSLGFKADFSSNELYAGRISNVKSKDAGVTGTPGKELRFGQEAEGSAQDAEGDHAWGLKIKYSGLTSGNSGTLTIDFTLMVGGDAYVYTARIPLTELKQIGSEWEYVFAGDYNLVGGPAGDQKPVGNAGSLTAKLTFWGDGTLYRADYSLTS